MSQIRPCLAHLWGLRQPPRSAPPPERPLATLAPPGGGRKAASLQMPTVVSAPRFPWGGKRQGTAHHSYGVTAQGRCTALRPAQGPLLPSLPQSSRGSRGTPALLCPSPPHPPPQGSERWRPGLEVQPLELALKRQERLGLTSLAEEALCESLALFLTAVGWPSPTTASPANERKTGTTVGCGGMCAPQGLPWPALLPAAHSWDRPGVHG